jgi:hypothetical protein
MHALPPRVALVPNAIAFRDPAHGVLAGGWTSCAVGGGAFGCRPQGTIQLTSDGGRIWRVVFRTAEPVVSVTYQSPREIRAVLEDGANRASDDGGLHWHPAYTAIGPVAGPCAPTYWASYVSGDWALCTGQGGAGSMGKAVYRLGPHGWRRVAYTPFSAHGGYGGISVYGYPMGIAMAPDGFGVIWESRGTLYVTRNGGSLWTGLEHVARPEVDFGVSAAALPHGVGYVVLAHGGSMRRRLLRTDDGGRTWRVVRRWH